MLPILLRSGIHVAKKSAAQAESASVSAASGGGVLDFGRGFWNPARSLLAELDRIIDGDRYPFSPRIRTLTAIRDKIRPPVVREPLPPVRSYAPPRAKASRRRG